MLNNLPRNAYTNAPQQHPNLILGSLQLLFWLIFRPAALHNHLKRIDPALDIDSKRRYRVHWQNHALWKLLVQGYTVLPFLVNLIVSFLLWWRLDESAKWRWGESVKNILFLVGWNVTSGLVLGLASCMMFGKAFGMGFGVAFGSVFGVALWGVALWGVALWDIGECRAK